MLPVPWEPPKVIIFYGIKNPQFATRIDERGNGCFILSLMNQTVNRHHPAHEKAMFFKGLDRISGAGGKAGASIPVDCRNMIPENRDKPKPRVEPGVIRSESKIGSARHFIF
jgi:hypothetical protein